MASGAHFQLQPAQACNSNRLTLQVLELRGLDQVHLREEERVQGGGSSWLVHLVTNGPRQPLPAAPQARVN